MSGPRKNDSAAIASVASSNSVLSVLRSSEPDTSMSSSREIR